MMALRPRRTFTDTAPMLTVVSEWFPPHASAASIILNNILSAYPSNITAIVGANYTGTFDPTASMPCHAQTLPVAHCPRLHAALRRRWPWYVTRVMKAMIQNNVKKLKSDVIMAVYPYEDMLVAGFLAAQTLNLPFYAYMHALWSPNMEAGSARARFAEHWEPLIMREATRVICITEGMKAYYEAHYGIKAHLLPHTVADEDLARAPHGLAPPQLPRPTILFIGGVSPEFNVDALRTVARACDLLPPEYELLLISPGQDVASLRAWGIKSTRLSVRYVRPGEAKALASRANVLVTPLSHKDCSHEEVRAAFSTKLLMYWLSGRPIVVSGPEDCYQVSCARQQGWGYVVTEDSPERLAKAFTTVNTDESLARRLVTAAQREASTRSPGRYAEALEQWVASDVLSQSRRFPHDRN